MLTLVFWLGPGLLLVGVLILTLAVLMAVNTAMECIQQRRIMIPGLGQELERI